MADYLEQAEEVQEALGRSYGMPDVDEDELEAGKTIFFCWFAPLFWCFLFRIKNLVLFTELAALGDELALDEDTSYLDNAVAAPSVPSKEPGAESIAAGPRGIQVDEFGLPQITR